MSRKLKKLLAFVIAMVMIVGAQSFTIVSAADKSQLDALIDTVINLPIDRDSDLYEVLIEKQGKALTVSASNKAGSIDAAYLALNLAYDAYMAEIEEPGTTTTTSEEDIDTGSTTTSEEDIDTGSTTTSEEDVDTGSTTTSEAELTDQEVVDAILAAILNHPDKIEDNYYGISALDMETLQALLVDLYPDGVFRYPSPIKGTDNSGAYAEFLTYMYWAYTTDDGKVIRIGISDDDTDLLIVSIIPAGDVDAALATKAASFEKRTWNAQKLMEALMKAYDLGDLGDDEIELDAAGKFLQKILGAKGYSINADASVVTLGPSSDFYGLKDFDKDITVSLIDTDANKILEEYKNVIQQFKKFTVGEDSQGYFEATINVLKWLKDLPDSGASDLEVRAVEQAYNTVKETYKALDDLEDLLGGSGNVSSVRALLNAALVSARATATALSGYANSYSKSAAPAYNYAVLAPSFKKYADLFESLSETLTAILNSTPVTLATRTKLAATFDAIIDTMNVAGETAVFVATFAAHINYASAPPIGFYGDADDFQKPSTTLDQKSAIVETFATAFAKKIAGLDAKALAEIIANDGGSPAKEYHKIDGGLKANDFKTTSWASWAAIWKTDTIIDKLEEYLNDGDDVPQILEELLWTAGIDVLAYARSMEENEKILNPAVTKYYITITSVANPIGTWAAKTRSNQYYLLLQGYARELYKAIDKANGYALDPDILKDLKTDDKIRGQLTQWFAKFDSTVKDNGESKTLVWAGATHVQYTDEPYFAYLVYDKELNELFIKIFDGEGTNVGKAAYSWDEIVQYDDAEIDYIVNEFQW